MPHPDRTILADTRWREMGGIGRFAREILARLKDAKPLLAPGSPVDPIDPWRIWRALRRTPHDVYFSPGFNAPWRSPKPFVFVIHDLIHLDVPAESTRLKRLYYQAVVRPAARRASGVLTVSRYSRQRIAAWVGIDERRITVVGNGVSACFTSDGAVYNSPQPYFLYVGDRKPHKNIDSLLYAMAELPRDLEVRLVMTGTPDERTAALVERCRLTERVTFAGYLTDTQLASMYRGAVGLVIPSYIEGFGLPAIEAMACGTPVIASTAAALAEVTGDAALHISPDEIDELSLAMARLLEDQQLRATLRERGLARGACFNWDDVAARVQAVLDEAATG